MAPDTDQSSDEESYTTTNVLLGYASKEPTDDGFSQLGGYPKWPDDSSPPSADLAKCKTCNNLMTLLLQLNGDLPEKYAGHERKLYIFSCRRKACRKKGATVRAIRGVRITKAATDKGHEANLASERRQKKPNPNLGSNLFNSTFSVNRSNSNPFSTTPGPTPNANPFGPKETSTTPSPFASLASKTPQPPTIDFSSTFAEKARIASPPPPAPLPKEAWPPQSALPKPYPSYYLDADYESLEPDPPTSSKPTMEIDIEGASSKDEKEAFESTIDKTFQKFADRLAQNPEQVLRYDFGGTPLLYSKTDAVGKLLSPPSASSSSSTKVKTVPQQMGALPRCQNCGSARVFELQLVPQAIVELEAEETGLEGMEWGTIVLGVCEKDCGERGVAVGEMGWVEEWVGVQWEEEGEKKGT